MKPEPRQAPADAHDDAPAAWLSALADGRADALDPACAHWRDDAHARRDWHAYHLIGDVMRSEDLACNAAGDAAFLAAVCARLAAEPVVLAPAAAPQRRRQPWLVPVAAAAGFALVAGVLVVTRLAQPGAPGDAGSLVAQEAAAARSNSAPELTGQAVLRDPVVDEFIRVHRSVGSSVAMSAPGLPLRRVELALQPAAER